MTYSFSSEDSSEETQHLQRSIQQSLQQLAVQIGESIDQETVELLYQEAVELLNHMAYAPITLARVAGTLLVFQLQPVEPEELAWFRTQVRQCPDDEEVEELIESMHRTDAL